MKAETTLVFSLNLSILFEIKVDMIFYHSHTADTLRIKKSYNVQIEQKGGFRTATTLTLEVLTSVHWEKSMILVDPPGSSKII